MTFRLSLLVGATALLSACDAGAPSPSEPLAIEPRYAATTTTTNTVVPDAFVVFVSCANGGAGENVLVTGDLHVLSHTTVSNSGNSVTRTQFQPQGMTGTGAITGDTYRATGVTETTTHGTGTFIYVNNYRFIGPGPDNNFMVHQTFQVVVNANGGVNINTQNTSITCR
jgi:hypothetical protein